MNRGLDRLVISRVDVEMSYSILFILVMVRAGERRLLREERKRKESRERLWSSAPAPTPTCRSGGNMSLPTRLGVDAKRALRIFFGISMP
jgi:hypothetical protein